MSYHSVRSDCVYLIRHSFTLSMHSFTHSLIHRLTPSHSFIYRPAQSLTPFRSTPNFSPFLRLFFHFLLPSSPLLYLLFVLPLHRLSLHFPDPPIISPFPPSPSPTLLLLLQPSRYFSNPPANTPTVLLLLKPFFYFSEPPSTSPTLPPLLPPPSLHLPSPPF